MAVLERVKALFDLRKSKDSVFMLLLVIDIEYDIAKRFWLLHDNLPKN